MYSSDCLGDFKERLAKRLCNRSRRALKDSNIVILLIDQRLSSFFIQEWKVQALNLKFQEAWLGGCSHVNRSDS